MAVVDVVKRQANLLKKVSYEGSGSETALSNGRYSISLNHSPVYGVSSVTKNGTALVLNTTYFWPTGRSNIEVTAAPAQNDYYEATILVRLDDAAITDYINESKQQVLAPLVQFYDAALDLTTYTTIETIQAMYATGRIKEDTAAGVALESAQYRSGHDLKRLALEMVKMIQRGELSIIDSSDNEVARKKGTVVGGFFHANGDILDREDIRERLSEWDRIYLPFVPFTTSVEGSE